MKRRTATRPQQPRALVTGGGGGIGQAICQALAAQGCHVFVHASGNPERAGTLADNLRKEGYSATSVTFDLTDPDATEQGMAGILETGPLHVIVHNAGVHADSPMAGMDRMDWERVVDVNLHGFYRVVQPALLPMCRARWGRVIAISSVAGRLGNRGQANYAAAKAGLHGATFSLAREVGGRGITCNVVAPGIIESGMAEGQFDDDAVAHLVPGGRPGKPGDVAALVGFLCREAAGYINGQVIGVDGGMACG